MTTLYMIRVRDVYCGARGEYVEEQDVLNEAEAKKWAREWRSMYSKDDGYSVTITRRALHQTA